MGLWLEEPFMTFRWQGKIYDTVNMRQFETGNPAMPFIYVTKDDGKVFLVRIDRLEGIEIRLADATEAKSLAERHNLPQLLTVSAGDGSAHSQDQESSLKWHALIVEDNGSSRHALGKLLNRSGWETASAATIAEARTELNRQPKFLILDLNLPDGEGTSLLRQVRSENLPIKVAITTAVTDPALLAEVRELRPDAIFRKPVDLTEILNWLEAA
ncbi:MAG: response regulator [Opitutaceae bacterium]